MDNSVNYIIEESVNDYLLTEIFGFGKKGVEITGYEPQEKKLYGRLTKKPEERVWINVEINYEEGKLKKITATNPENDKTFKAKITNLPEEGKIMFIAEDEDDEGKYFGINDKLKLFAFYKSPQDGQFYYDSEDGEENIADVSWFPESLEYQEQPNETQDGYYPQQQDGYYPQQQGGYYPQQQGGYYPQQQGGYYPQQQGGYYPQQQDGYYPQQQGGYYPQQQGGYYPQQQDGDPENKILDLDRENPLSTAITKLIDSRQLRNTTTATYLIRDLYNLDL